MEEGKWPVEAPKEEQKEPKEQKKRKKTMTLPRFWVALSWCLVAVLAVGQVLCWRSLRQVEREIGRMNGQLLQTRNEINNTLSGVYDQIAQEMTVSQSLVEAQDVRFFNVNWAEKTVMASFSVSLKESTSRAQVQLVLGDDVVEMEKENGRFVGEGKVDVLKSVEGRLVVVENGVEKTESMWFSGPPRESLLPSFSPEFPHSLEYKMARSDVEKPAFVLEGTLWASQVLTDVTFTDWYFVVMEEGNRIYETTFSLDETKGEEIQLRQEVTPGAKVKMYVVAKDSVGLYHVVCVNILETDEFGKFIEPNEMLDWQEELYDAQGNQIV